MTRQEFGKVPKSFRLQLKVQACLKHKADVQALYWCRMVDVANQGKVSTDTNLIITELLHPHLERIILSKNIRVSYCDGCVQMYVPLNLWNEWWGYNGYVNVIILDEWLNELVQEGLMKIGKLDLAVKARKLLDGYLSDEQLWCYATRAAEAGKLDESKKACELLRYDPSDAYDACYKIAAGVPAH